MTVSQYDPKTGGWRPAVPPPYSHGLMRWLWLRLTGYRDAYGRKAELLLPWE